MSNYLKWPHTQVAVFAAAAFALEAASVADDEKRGGLAVGFGETDVADVAGADCGRSRALANTGNFMESDPRCVYQPPNYTAA
jgi:hypothetical protein